ncbi:hypothetical protein [Brevundimonas sp.]|uniref:hypothetical protein n=1 Tax=Brevundimonas sp. TaxID=1871086 RepID=UPI003D0E626C
MSVTESTAIRWSKRPGFPVVRSSDGGSVYALTSEIDAWIAGKTAHTPAGTGAALPAPAGMAEAGAVSTTTSRTRRLLIAGGAAILGGAVAGGVVLMRRDPRGSSRPEIRDPELEALYIDARSDAAARTLESLNRAADKFRNLVARYPDFVPGFTGLADTYILSCEFGSTDRAAAFRDARAAVSTALAMEPDDADANRIMGFLTYWTTRDVAAARPFFQKAVGAGRTDDLSHLWFGNALIDGGRVAEGLEQLRRALLLAPDSPAVLTDYAMGLWQAGQSRASLTRLADVEARFPTHSAAPNAAALFHLQAGDIGAYLEQSRRWATLIGDARQTARIAAEATVFASGGSQTTLRLIAGSTPIVSSFWHGGELPVAMAASMIGDRPRVLAILTAVADRGVTWRNLRFPAESFLRWKDDPELRGLLRRVLDPATFPDYPKG